METSVAEPGESAGREKREVRDVRGCCRSLYSISLDTAAEETSPSIPMMPMGDLGPGFKEQNVDQVA
jgi:hypothetical protein